MRGLREDRCRFYVLLAVVKLSTQLSLSVHRRESSDSGEPNQFRVVADTSTAWDWHTAHHFNKETWSDPCVTANSGVSLWCML